MGIFEGFKKYIATEGEKAKDPVCGMHILKDTALKSEFKGQVFYFCSQNCKDQFDKEPEKYA